MRVKIAGKSTLNILLLSAVFGMIAPVVSAYPPDNAAVLYYKACLTYQNPSDAVKDNLTDIIQNGAEPTEETKKFLADEESTIRSMTVASDIEHCDWGHDYSEGFELVMPALSNMRSISRIVMADGICALQQGDYETALDRCITTYKIGRHMKDRTLIGNLVGIAIEKMAGNGVRQILGAGLGKDLLVSVKGALAKISTYQVPLSKCLQLEYEVVENTPTQRLIEIVNEATNPGTQPPEVPAELALANVEYYKKQMDRLINAVALPYLEAMAAIEIVNKQVADDAKVKPEAGLTGALIPAVHSVLSVETKGRTDINALRTAVEIYLIKATTGNLPDSLPAQMPKDMFSGRDFEYKTTKTGFTLRCRAKNFKTDKIEEYAFKVAK